MALPRPDRARPADFLRVHDRHRWRRDLRPPRHRAAPDVGALDVWRHAGYAGGLFVPVKDARAGTTTYGGGRYLIDTIKGADLSDGDELVLVLTYAYNPSCAYDPMWACPLAPPATPFAHVGQHDLERRAAPRR